MLKIELRRLRRTALVAAAVVLSAGAPGCYVGPEPLPAEVPPQPPAQYGQQPYGQQPMQPQDYGQQQAPMPQEPQQQAQASDDDVKVDDFYEPLSAYGTWLDTPEYGRVWQPADDVAGESFVPYASDGSWAVNDDGDWVFQSKYDNEFGWATYHYGRWAEHDDYGWVWVPGTVWAPSWVEWRYGNGYVGWVPMGPPGVVVIESRWFFVEERYFGSPTILSFRLGPDRARVAYMAAAPIVEVRARGRWTVGPPVARVRASGVAVRTVPARPPPRGYVRATARAVTHAAAATRAGRRPAQPRVRHSAPRHAPPAHHDAPAHHAPPAHHDTPKHQPPARHDTPKHQPPPRHQAAPPPKPKPAPAAPARRGGKRR